MRFTTTAVLGAVAGAVLLAVPATADDLIYQVKSGHPDILTTFGGEPYWKPLARCSGIYTWIAQDQRNKGKATAADAVDQERGMFMNAYGQRLMKDRGLDAKGAMAVAHDELMSSYDMMEKAVQEDPNASAELLGQCEAAYNIIVQETAGK